MELVGNVHLATGGESDIESVLELLRGSGIEPTANPDLYVRTYGNFGIDEARDLSERASARGFSGRRVFLITADSLTHEAQNALLKTLEEPAGNALFIFLVPAPDMLLSTLRSRAQRLELVHATTGQEQVIDAKKFVSATPAQRLDMLKPLLEKGDDDKRDFGAIASFLGSVERALADRPASLLAVYRARKYIGDRGALVKPLLEQMALLV